MIPGVIGITAGLLATTADVAVNPVGINNETISKTNTDGTAATASFTFKTDRTVTDQDGGSVDPKWLDDGYSASDYQIRVTKVSGTTPSGASLGTWLGLSSNRTWSLTDSAGAAGSKSCTLTVEIRDAAAPNTIRDTATYTLEADSQAGGGGGAVDWDDIDVTRSTSSISASNTAQTMGSSGTLSIARSLDPDLSVAVVKNGSNIGFVTSVSVSAGDTISFTASGSAFANPETRSGTVTVSGLYSDIIAVSLTRSTL